MSALVALLITMGLSVSGEEPSLSLVYGWSREIIGPGDSVVESFSGTDRYYVADDALLYESYENKLRILVHGGSRQVTIVDDHHKTYLTTPLPFDPASVLTPVSALRLRSGTRRSGTVEQTDETRSIAGYPCRLHIVRIAAPNPIEIRVWMTTDIAQSIDGYAAYIDEIRRFLFPYFSEDIRSDWLGIPGVPVRIESMAHGRDSKTRTRHELVETALARLPVLEVERDREYAKKPKITHTELLSQILGPPQREYSQDERAVLRVVEEFAAGYRERDLEALDGWIERLLTEDVFVLGTDAAFPDSWEWRRGKEAAREMFERDWSRWGNVEIFSDEISMGIDGDSAWVAAFATVTRHGDDMERSRQRSLGRIERYSTNEEWSSRLALYEILADATNVLVQYERDSKFVWPLRAQFGLRRDGKKWLIRTIQFSHPARGFRAWRLVEE
jgi:ketosteroid isomerase-like protein